MRKRIKKNSWCSTSRGKSNVRSLKEENIVKRKLSDEERISILKEEMKKTISREKYVIRNVNGEKKIFILTAKGNLGEGILC